MITGNISGYTHGTAIELQYSAAMAAVLMLSRRWPSRAEAAGASFQAHAHGLTHFTHRSRLVIRIVLFTLMGCTLPCGAVTLGDATLLSGPAQPLRVEIELASEPQPGLQVRLASEQAFRENGIAYPAWLGRAQVSLLPAQGARRRAALLLQAPQAAQAQLVELVLEFSWPTGSSQQIHVLLLDAPARPRETSAAAEPVVPTVMVPPPDDSTGAMPSGAEISPPAAPARAGLVHGMTFETMLRFPFKSREHAGAVSTPRAPAPAKGPVQDRLRLAQAKPAEAERIAQERRQADQQARLQELERNARQMRELAAEVAAAAPPARAASAAAPAASAPEAAAPPAPVVEAATVPKVVSVPPKQPGRHTERTSLWPWVAGLAAPLLAAAGGLFFWRARRRRRPDFADSGGAARSVFELSPAEAEQAYTAYVHQQAPATRADASEVENARALFVLGRLADAQQLLDTLLRQNPRSHEAWFLLVRVLCVRGDRAGLAQRIPQLRELTGETGELWERVLTLGHELEPSNPFYQSAVRQPAPEVLPTTPEPQPEPAPQKPATPTASTASNAVDDALRMATAYGGRSA